MSDKFETVTLAKLPFSQILHILVNKKVKATFSVKKSFWSHSSWLRKVNKNNLMSIEYIEAMATEASPF